jgi:hypothetical protein
MCGCRRSSIADGRSAPWPSSLAKAAAKAQIEQLAEPGAPDCVEHNLPVSFDDADGAGAQRRSPAAIGFTQTDDALGLLCWLFHDQLLREINIALDEAADDKNSLNEQQRSEMEATIMADALVIESNECVLIWHAEAKGEVIDFRGDTTPQALLGVKLVTAPRANPSGTSPEHVITFGGRR